MRGWDLSSSVYQDQPGRVELQYRALAVDFIRVR